MTSAESLSSAPCCAKFRVCQRVAITSKGASPSVGTVDSVIAPSRDMVSTALDVDANSFRYRVRFVRLFSPSLGMEDLAETATEFTRRKMREDDLFRKILPPVSLDGLDDALAAWPGLLGKFEPDLGFFNVFPERELEIPVLEQIVERYRGELGT